MNENNKNYLINKLNYINNKMFYIQRRLKWAGIDEKELKDLNILFDKCVENHKQIVEKLRKIKT